MPLSAGDKLGPYEVVSLLGKGGMGEVYRARDAKLNRDVAMKVLPAALAGDGEYLARFQREAQTLAALNHPNIASIYGLEANAIVMELVEGATLQGPLPLDEALPIARQIAEALEAAHEKGIIHRDLKPGNIKVTPEGVVKVLDFGLAKAVERPAQSGADSPTLTMRATEAGLILGTAGYMSPEQAAGKPVDRRADIWSFGVVFYELLTGKRLFDGETVTHTLADVVRAPIDLTAIPEGRVRDLILRCLDRNVKNRLAHIAEARIAIDNVASAPAAARAMAKASGWPWAVAGASTLAFLVASILLYNAARPAPLRPMMHLNVDFPPSTPLARSEIGSGIDGDMLALSPDGSRLAVSLRGADGKPRLYTRLMEQSLVTPLTGTENAHGPFFSPDGNWIGFFADRKLKKIAVEGGAAVALCDASRGRGASWGDDGNIIAALGQSNGLSRIPSAGGSPVPVTVVSDPDISHRWPQVLPGSQAVLFTALAQGAESADAATIEILSLPTGEQKTVHRGGFFPRYLAGAAGSTANGHLVYLRGATLFAVPFHAGRLAFAGTPAPVLQDVGSTAVAGGDFALAANGTLIYLAGRPARRSYPISWVESGDKTKQLLHPPPGRYYSPRFSPDGKRLAFALSTDKGRDIWVKDLDRDTASRLTSVPGNNDLPVWTPNGESIVFVSTNPAAPGLYAIRSDGSGDAKQLTQGQQVNYSVSPNGKRLAIHQHRSQTSWDIFTLPMESDPEPGSAGVRLGKAELFLGTKFAEYSPAFSPDGRWIAYISNESGTDEVYVRPYSLPGGSLGGRWQVSTGGGRTPAWSRGAKEVFFSSPDGRVMATAYTVKGDTFVPGKPKVWAEVRVKNHSVSPAFDLAPDGKRLAAFLADENDANKLPASLTVLIHFADELRRKAPAKD